MRTKTLLTVGALAGVAGTAIVANRRVRSMIEGWATNFDACDGDPETMPDGADVEVTAPDGAVLRGLDCGSGPTVLLAHCWTGTRCNWAPVARRLVADGFRVVTFDQRGHGASDRGVAPYAPETLGQDVATIIEDLDLRDLVLAGHSMGGLAAMAFAAFHRELAHERVSGLVLVATLASAPLPPRVPEIGLDLAPALPLLGRTMGHADYGLLGLLQVFGSQPARCQLEAARRGYLTTDVTTRAEAVTMMCTFDLRPVLPDIALPTHVLAGRKDQLTWPHSNQAIAELIPGATIEFLDGKGHMLPWEAPDEVTEAIVQASKATAA